MTFKTMFFAVFEISFRSRAQVRHRKFTHANGIMPELKTFSYKDVKEHKTAKSTYLAIYDKVYDVTKFLEEVSIVFCLEMSLSFLTAWWVEKFNVKFVDFKCHQNLLLLFSSRN